MQELQNNTKPTENEGEKFRPGCAIDLDLKDGFKQLLDVSGARFFSRLVAIMAADPERAGKLLQPMVAEHEARARDENPALAKRRQMYRLSKLTDGMTTAEFEAAMAALAAKRG